MNTEIQALPLPEYQRRQAIARLLAFVLFIRFQELERQILIDRLKSQSAQTGAFLLSFLRILPQRPV